MRNIFKVDQASESIHVALLIARFGIAGLMLIHGLPKLAMLLSGQAEKFPHVFGMSSELSLGLAIFSEVLCSVFLLLGFATRLAVIPLAITMLIAVAIVHANDPFASKELGLHYIMVYIILFLSGSGKYSIDHFLQRKRLPASGTE